MDSQIKSIGSAVLALPDERTKSTFNGYAGVLVAVCELLKEQGHVIKWSWTPDFLVVKRVIGNRTISRDFIAADEDIPKLKEFTNDLRSLVVCPAHGSAPQLGVSA